jgi:hypothetical protein
LKALKNLKQLRLNGTDVCDDTLIHVAELTSLEDLWLNGTRITNEGMKHLVTLTNLKELIVNETAVTEKGASVIRRALPKCEHIQYGLILSENAYAKRSKSDK